MEFPTLIGPVQFHFKGCWVIFFIFFPNFNLFVWLRFYVLVSCYGHVETVSSPNHTFFLGKLDIVVNQYFVHIFSLVTVTSWISGRRRKNAELFHNQSSQKYGTGQGSNLWPLDLQSGPWLRTNESGLYQFEHSLGFEHTLGLCSHGYNSASTVLYPGISARFLQHD